MPQPSYRKDRDDQAVVATLGPRIRHALDAWIAARSNPKPSGPEAIRSILMDRLIQDGHLQSDAALDREIANQRAKIDGMPAPAGVSPAAGMAAMDKAVADNDLTEMRNERQLRKISKASDRRATASVRSDQPEQDRTAAHAGVGDLNGDE